MEVIEQPTTIIMSIVKNIFSKIVDRLYLRDNNLQVLIKGNHNYNQKNKGGNKKNL